MILRHRSRPWLLSVALLAAGAVVLSVPPVVHADAQLADVLLSQGKTTISSSSEDSETSEFSSGKAVDGKSTTRWASDPGSDPQWIRIDFGERVGVHRVKLSWEAAYGKNYRIEVSDNGWQWTTIRSVTNGNGGTDDITGLDGHGRFMRLVGTARGTAYGYSLWELQAYGVPDSVGDTVPPSTPASLQARAASANSVEMSWNPATDNVHVSGYDVLRNGAVIAVSRDPSYTDSGLAPATSYTYALRARDAAGNLSAASTAIAVSTPSGGSGHPFVVAAAGDIADQCTASDPKCIHPKTAALVRAMAPAAVITMGDNQYDDAHLSDFRNYFDTTWGKFKSIMRPSPGNHETYDEPPLAGYKGYFGAIATPQGKTYYSWDMGDWHFVSLDSNDFVAGFANGEFDDAADPPQIAWLKQDLAKTTKRCIGAYYHHPRFSSGDHGDNLGMAAMWTTLVDNKVDLVLSGHDHHYQRFVPQGASGAPDARGPATVIGGGGGKDLYAIDAPHPATAKLLSTHGVLRLHFTDTTFATQLIGLDGTVLDSSPTYTCH